MAEDGLGLQTQTGISWNGTTGIVEYGNDKGMIVMFYYRPVLNNAKSVELGRPFYEDVVFVRYHPAGERLNINDRPADDNHKRRWPAQWMQFQQNKAQTSEGTPIDLLFPETPSVAAMLRASHVQTIEQCAALSSDAIESIGMGAQTYVNKATKYLEAANKGVSATKLQKELDTRDSEIRTLKHEIDLMKQELERRTSENGAVDVAEITRQVMQQMGRPVMPPSQMNAKGQSFDAQTAQIDALKSEEIPARPTRRKSK